MTSAVPGMKPPRNNAYDNLRGILIFCVVFAHLLEGAAGFPFMDTLYRVIYSFHMPVFLFLFGYFARFSPRKIVFSFALPYGLFQALYILFDRYALGKETPLQFTTPYWLLWYLLVCIFYQLLIPFFDTDSTKKQIFRVIAAIVLALAAGYDKTVFYYGSLSRFVVFLPWFLLGLYSGKYRRCIEDRIRSLKPLHFVIAGGGVLGAGAVVHFYRLRSAVFYGSYPYENLEYSPLVRLLLMGLAAVWLVFLLMICCCFLCRRVPLLTTLGQNTLPVFLLHGFAARWIPGHAPGLLSHPLYTLGVTLGLLALLGNPWVGGAFRWLFSDKWLPKAMKEEPW